MTQTNKPLLFRFHKGLLEDSMKTVREVDSLEFLIWLINYSWDLQPVEIRIEYYVYDDRIDWDTHIVTARFKGLEKDGLMPVGFLNRKPEWSLKDYERIEHPRSKEEPEVPCQIL